MVSHRKQTVHKKKNQYGLVRPKRAVTGYNLFIRKFIKSKAVKSTQDARKAIKEGARKWNQLSLDEKNKYEASTYRDRCRYQEQMEEYRLELKSMKCPRNSYVAFLRDYCTGQFGILPFKLGFRQIGILSRAASTVWRGLTTWRKQDYKNEFKKIFAQHKHRLVERERCHKGHCKFQLNDQETDEEDEEDEQQEEVLENNGTNPRYNLNQFEEFTRPIYGRNLDLFDVQSKNKRNVDMDVDEEIEENDQENEAQGWKGRLRKPKNGPGFYRSITRTRQRDVADITGNRRR